MAENTFCVAACTHHTDRVSDPQAAQTDDLTTLLARMRDYFALRTPWHRRLWTIGTVLGLREVQEYAEACLNDSAAAFWRRCRDWFDKLNVGIDAAIGDTPASRVNNLCGHYT